MKPARALLLFDTPENGDLLRSTLRAEGYEAEEAPLAGTAAPAEDYCLVVFDVQRITRALIELASAWRDSDPAATLVVVGGHATRPKRIALLECGVDAYLTKPIAIAELRARLRTALRRFRSQNAPSRHISIGGGTIDLEARRVTASGHVAHLTPTECGILQQLAAHLNQTVPCSELIRSLWGSDPQKGVHSLRLFIRRLRQKLEPDPAHPRYLVTDPTIGYRLQIPSGDRLTSR